MVDGEWETAHRFFFFARGLVGVPLRHMRLLCCVLWTCAFGRLTHLRASVRLLRRKGSRVGNYANTSFAMFRAANFGDNTSIYGTLLGSAYRTKFIRGLGLVGLRSLKLLCFVVCI